MIEVFEDDFLAEDSPISRSRLFSWPFSTKELKDYELERPLSPLVLDLLPATSSHGSEVLFGNDSYPGVSITGKANYYISPDADAFLGEPESPVSEEEGRRDCLGFLFSSPELGPEIDSPVSASPSSNCRAEEWSSEGSPRASPVYASSPVQGFSQFTPAQLIPFPEYKEVATSPSIGGLSSMEMDEVYEPGPETIVIREEDLESTSPLSSLTNDSAPDPAMRSPVVSPTDSLPSFGGFSFTCESPIQYSCSNDSGERTPASPSEHWAHRSDSLSLDSQEYMDYLRMQEQNETIDSPSEHRIRCSESLSFDSPSYVQEFCAIMQQDFENNPPEDEGHVLLPSTPFLSPLKTTPALLDEVSHLLNYHAAQAWSSAPSTPASPVPRTEKPTLKLVIDFAVPYPTGPLFAPQSISEEKAPAQEPAPVRPAPVQHTSTLRFVSPEDKHATGARKAVYPKDTYPAARKSLGKCKGTISDTDQETKKAKVTRPAKPKRRITRKKVTRVVAQRRDSPPQFEPFPTFFEDLGPVKLVKGNGLLGWMHPLFKPAQNQEKAPKGSATTQGIHAKGFGKAAVTFLSLAGLYLALQGGRCA